MESLAGKTLGQYRFERLLASGSLADVYQARDERLERPVAIKITARPAALERFRAEARLTGSLDHPNILPVYDFGEQGGITYLVRHYASGGSLADRLRGANGKQGLPLGRGRLLSGPGRRCPGLHPYQRHHPWQPQAIEPLAARALADAGRFRGCVSNGENGPGITACRCQQWTLQRPRTTQRRSGRASRGYVRAGGDFLSPALGEPPTRCCDRKRDICCQPLKRPCQDWPPTPHRQ